MGLKTIEIKVTTPQGWGFGIRLEWDETPTTIGSSSPTCVSVYGTIVSAKVTAIGQVIIYDKVPSTQLEEIKQATIQKACEEATKLLDAQIKVLVSPYLGCPNECPMQFRKQYGEYRIGEPQLTVDVNFWRDGLAWVVEVTRDAAFIVRCGEITPEEEKEMLYNLMISDYTKMKNQNRREEEVKPLILKQNEETRSRLLQDIEEARKQRP